jgi:hypothetical protein
MPSLRQHDIFSQSPPIHCLPKLALRWKSQRGSFRHMYDLLRPKHTTALPVEMCGL